MEYKYTYQLDKPRVWTLEDVRQVLKQTGADDTFGFLTEGVTPRKAWGFTVDNDDNALRVTPTCNWDKHDWQQMKDSSQSVLYQQPPNLFYQKIQLP